MKSWEDFSLEAHKNGYSKELAREFIYTAYEYHWSSGYNVIKQVISWKNVNYKELVNEIKDMFKEKNTNSAERFMRDAIEAIPMGIKDTAKMNKEMKDKAQKFSNKPLKLKEDVSITEKQEIDKLNSPTRLLFYGIKHGYSYYLLQKLIKHYPEYVVRAGRDWPNFDFQKGYDVIIKEKDALNLYRAGIDWNWGKFPKQQALEFLKLWGCSHNLERTYYERALDKWPKNIKETEKAIEEIKAKSTKLPNKPLKLKESVLDDHPYIYGDKKELTLKEIIEDLFLNRPTIAWSNVGYMLSAPEKFSKDDREALYNFLQKFPVPIEDKGYSKGYRFYDDLMRGLKPIKHAEQTIDKIKKASKKMPNKPLKLKEEI